MSVDVLGARHDAHSRSSIRYERPDMVVENNHLIPNITILPIRRQETGLLVGDAPTSLQDDPSILRLSKVHSGDTGFLPADVKYW